MSKIQSVRAPACYLAAILAFVIFFGAAPCLRAQSTAFTYQGRLNSKGAAANGVFDFQFSLMDAGTNGALIAGPVTNAATAVSNGMFTVRLDFGPRAFSAGAPRWLQIGVRASGSTNAFSILKPRQPVAAIPSSRVTRLAGSNQLLPCEDRASRSAGFQTCCIADFQIGLALEVPRRAGLETGDTANSEVCATVELQAPRRPDSENQSATDTV